MTSSNPRRLAIDGGRPAFPEGPPGWPTQDEAVHRALEEVFADGNWGRYEGPYLEKLAAGLAAKHRVRHVRLCSSGTIAVELALRGLKVGEGDEVVLAAYDFPGNFRAIEAVGARPVLVDLAPGGWTIDAAAIERALSPQVRAVVLSHLHGSQADMRQIRELAERHGLAIVEDASQAPGATVQGRPAGSWGDVGVLSFGGSKLLTAGRGGAVLTQRDEVAQRITIFADRGNDAFPISQIQAAILLPQLAALEVRHAARLASVQRLVRQVGQFPWLQPVALPAGPSGADDVAADNSPAFYKMGWLISAGGNNGLSVEAASLARSWFAKALRAEGVAMDEGFRGFLRRTSARCRVAGPLENAVRAVAQTAILHHPALLQPTEYIDRLAAAIRDVASQLPARISNAPAADQ